MSPIWLTLLLQVGCAVRPRSVEGHDFVLSSCNAPPLRLAFGLLKTDCDSVPGSRGNIIVDLRDALPADGMETYEIGEKGTASATWCSANGQRCVSASGGFVRINGLDEGLVVSGDYSLVFNKYRTIEGTFGAEWCPPSTPCDKTQQGSLW
jgi:hypothetical protein